MNDNMEKNNFWNSAARQGAILGAVLAVSSVLENMMMLSGRLTLYALLTVETIAVIVLHYYLLHRYTRQRAALYTAGEGFTFGQGYGYLLAVSGFAGVIVGIVQYLYLHVIVGYGNYVDRMVETMTQMLAASGGMTAAMEPLMSQTLAQLQSAPEPSVLSTVWSGIFSSLLFGAFFGLIIAGVQTRSPRPFDNGQTEA